MTKTTKLWISPELELMHAINGWPEQPEFNGDYFVHYGTQKRYEAALAKAKAESILVEQSDNTPITMFKGVLEPDEFIDFEGEVEVVCQWKWLDGWRDCDITEYQNRQTNMNKTRQVARLKPVDDTMTDAEMNDALEALKDQCPAGTKYRILEAFKYKCSGLGPKMQHDLLAQVLDDLKIK